MHNTFIIAKREYLERVRSRSFVIMTFFIPLLMFGVTVVPTLLMNRGSNETKHMVVVAGDRDTAEMIRSRIEQRQELDHRLHERVDDAEHRRGDQQRCPARQRGVADEGDRRVERDGANEHQQPLL